MIYIECEGNGFVKYIHYVPFDEEHGLGKTEDELLVKGYLVDSVPEPPTTQLPTGQKYDLYYDKVTNTFSYTIAERELSFAEKLEVAKQINEDLLTKNKQLKDQQALMQSAIDDLILGGAL